MTEVKAHDDLAPTVPPLVKREVRQGVPQAGTPELLRPSMRFAVVLLCLLTATSAPAASLDGTQVHGLAWDPADPDRLLLATHHGLLALKGGDLTDVSASRDDFMGFTVHPGGHG